MREYWIKFKEWWSALSQREKQVVGAGSVVVGFFIFYVMIWSPLLEHINNMRETIHRQQTTLAWMKAADKVMRPLENKVNPTVSSLSLIELLSIVKNKINEAKLSAYLSQLKETNQDTIALQFQKIEFDTLIQFLISLIKEHGIVIAQLSVTAEGVPGMVNAELLLKSR